MQQWYPTFQLTVYFDKALDDNATLKMIDVLKQEYGTDKGHYLYRKETIGEFRNWSGFDGAMDMLEDNPLPAVAIIKPKVN
ncbi:permease-like cell division protein FtsX [Candidatus Doolittlea endobia]|uniref:permease-like cell division protein FtsX n=1 Tax=Candidatus Doolittlea endobia TaxID=1778262 RepID=UPI001E650065|nr:permease-like cell division protein FtsX [Candidatus Doolittlea endobia]